MSRDNFFVQLKGADNEALFIHLDNIAYVEEKEVKAQGKAATKQTLVHLVGGGHVVVQENMQSILSKAATYGVAKVMV
jgi:hypothetical protein